MAVFYSLLQSQYGSVCTRSSAQGSEDSVDKKQLRFMLPNYRPLVLSGHPPQTSTVSMEEFEFTCL
jgi:hypothetical protein